MMGTTERKQSRTTWNFQPTEADRERMQRLQQKLETMNRHEVIRRALQALEKQLKDTDCT